MGKRNFSIDFIQIFANITDGEFLKVVHHSLLDLGKVALAQIAFPYLSWFRLLSLQQQFTKIFTQRITPRCFYRPIRFFGMIIFTQPFGFTQVNPISGLVGYASETFSVDKGFKKIHRVVVNHLPIFGKVLGHTA